MIAQHFVDAISLGSLYALAVLGIALILGVMKLINYAHGDLIMVGGMRCPRSARIHGHF